MTNRLLIERLHEDASAQKEYELATNNRLVYDGNVPEDHFCRNLRIDDEAVGSFLRSYGAPDHTLGRMALYFYGSETERTEDIPISEGALGWVGGGKLVFSASKTIHYPLIGFDVSRHNSAAHLNTTFLHELRHVADVDKAPFCNSRTVINSTRGAIGALSMAVAASGIDTVYDSTTNLDIISAGILLGNSAFLAAAALNKKLIKSALYSYSKQEIAARRAERKGAKHGINVFVSD